MVKKKRPRYGNPARQAEENGRRDRADKALTSVRFLTPEDLDELSGDLAGGFNRLARPSCSDCGGPVEWLTGHEAATKGIDLSEAMEWLGVSEVPGREVWRCTQCGHFGVMAP